MRLWICSVCHCLACAMQALLLLSSDVRVRPLSLMALRLCIRACSWAFAPSLLLLGSSAHRTRRGSEWPVDEAAEERSEQTLQHKQAQRTSWQSVHVDNMQQQRNGQL